MRGAPARPAVRTSLLVALTAAAVALPVVAAPAADEPTASSHTRPSRYGDPCEATTTLDLRDVRVDDLFEDGQGTVRPGTVSVEARFCAPVAAAVGHTVRVDLHPRLDGPGGPDHGETPRRVLTIASDSSGWSWRLRDDRGSTVAAGGATAVGAPDAVTSVTAEVGACELAAASGTTCTSARRLPASGGSFPPIAVRACTADVDCGPAYRTVDGVTGPDPALVRNDVDYLPEPRAYPLGYPSACQSGSSAGVRHPAASGPGVPDDPYYGPEGPGGPTGQWALRRVGLEDARPSATGAGTRVAILDSGIDGTHPDLAGRAISVRDFVETRDGGTGGSLDRRADTDLSGHGTFVASLIAAATDDGVGMAALAPDARLLIARVFDAEGCASDDAIIAAMAWAVDSGADVLNLSFGGPGVSPALDIAGADAVSRGAVPVAAAGNSGGTVRDYPAAYPAYVSVAATGYADPSSREEDPVAGYSSRSDGIDLAAPGGSNTASQPSRDVLGACWESATVGHGWCRDSGTSFAAAIVSGAAALVRSVDPDRTPIGVVEALQDTARDITEAPHTGPGPDERTGAGRVDVGRAAAAVAGRHDTLDDLPRTEAATGASVAASRAAFPEGDARHVVLARSDVFADSLAGAALAADRGPVLLTPPGHLTAGVESELQRVMPGGGRVWVLGGEAAVSPAVVERVRALGYSPLRLHGPTRVETAAAVARQVGPDPSGQVLVASAADWPDAIAGGVYAADREVPLLLSWPDSAAPARSPGVLATARELGARELVVVGGEAALSTRVASELRTVAPVRRVAGDTRFATATEVSRELWGRTRGNAGDRFVVVNGDRTTGWAAGLASAPLGARRDAPLLLVNDGLSTDEPARYLRDVLRYRLDRPASGLLVGPVTDTTEPRTRAFTAQRLRELLGG